MWHARVPTSVTSHVNGIKSRAEGCDVNVWDIINSASNRNNYETWKKKKKTQPKKWLYILVNWPGARATAIFEFFFINGCKNTRARRRVTHLTVAELWPSWRDTEPNRVPSVATAHQPRQCLLLLDYWARTVQPTAAWGPRGRGQWECGQRLVATNQAAERREGGGESREAERRQRHGEEAHQGLMSFNLRGRPWEQQLNDTDGLSCVAKITWARFELWHELYSGVSCTWPGVWINLLLVKNKTPLAHFMSSTAVIFTVGFRVRGWNGI